MKKFLLIGLVLSSAMIFAQTPEPPAVAPLSPMKAYYKPNITAATPKNQITPQKWDTFFGIVDSVKMDIPKTSENVFYVLRNDSLSGKYGTIQYNAQLARARAGNSMLAYPSVYAARDAAYIFLSKNPTRRAVLKVLSGHYERICSYEKNLADADRVFAGDFKGIYATSAEQAVPPLFVYGSVADADVETADYRRIHPQKNPNASSLFLDRLDFLAEECTYFQFQGVSVWENYATQPNRVVFDSLNLVSSGLYFWTNTHTDYSVNFLGMACGFSNYYCHEFESQFVNINIHRATFRRSPYDAWGATGLILLRTSVPHAIAAISPRGKINIVVDKVVTPDTIACYGLYAIRATNSDIHVKINADSSFFYHSALFGDFQDRKINGREVRNCDIVVEGSVKSTRPTFPNNEQFSRVCFVSVSGANSFGNRIKIDGDFDIQNGMRFGAGCDVRMKGYIKMNSHQYAGTTYVPSFIANGGLRFEGRLETDSITVDTTKLKVLPGGSTNLINNFGLPVW